MAVKFYILSGISRLFKENVSYCVRVFFSETYKTEIIIEPFSFFYNNLIIFAPTNSRGFLIFLELLSNPNILPTLRYLTRIDKKESFTRKIGKKGWKMLHRTQPLTLVSRIFHVFRHVTSLRTRVWNWSQYITYLNATHETSFMFDCCMQFSIMFDCLSVRFPDVRQLYLLLSTHREWESFQLCRILQMLSTAATIEVSVVYLQCSLPC